MKKLLMGMALCALCTGAQAREYWLKSATADWSQAASFTVDSATGQDAPEPPGSADEVHLPDAVEVPLTAGTASFATAAGVKRIIPETDSRLVITVDNVEEGVENVVEFAAAVNAGQTSTIYQPKGTIVKLGTGSLRLTNKADSFCHYTSLDVRGGHLRLPPSTYAVHTYYADATVAAGATLNLPVTTYARFRSLNGPAGATVSAGIAGTTVNFLLESKNNCWRSDLVKQSVFDGVFTDKVLLNICGAIRLNGESSVNAAATEVRERNSADLLAVNGLVELKKFGQAGLPSSIGSDLWINFRSNGGGFRYLGETGTETTDKYIGIIGSEANRYNFFDAGAHGGVTFIGTWRYQYDQTKSAVHNFYLLGSNDTPCVISGPLTDWYRQNSPYRTDSPVFFTKSGSGVWKFTDDACGAESTSWLYGGFAVEEGRLQFTSIANVGEKCSLGYATYLTKPMNGPASAADMRDYAYLVGTTNEAKSAVFEYVGTGTALATNRAVAVVGTGTIRSSAPGRGNLLLRGVSPCDANDATLVLDGTNTCHNVIEGITDGDGKGNLSVVKRGSGTWTLAGDQKFHGALRVEEGLLTVCGSKYNWFRFTLKETGDPSDTVHLGQVCFKQLALFDREGVRRNVGLAVDVPTEVLKAGSSTFRGTPYWLSLPENGAQIANNVWHTLASGQYVDVLFSDSTSTPTFSTTLSYKDGNGNSAAKAFDRNDSTAWLQFVMRLDSTTPEIAAWDYTPFYTYDAVYTRWPKIVGMEGSTDGVTWETLPASELNAGQTGDDFDIDLTGGLDGFWMSDKTAFSAGQVRKDKGFRIRGRSPESVFSLSNVTAVAVHAGATLCAADDLVLPALDVDCSNCGTIEGFTMAESGTLSVTAPKAGRIDLPDFLVNAKDVENVANWSLKLNGQPSRGYDIVVKDGRISLLRRGLTLIVR